MWLCEWCCLLYVLCVIEFRFVNLSWVCMLAYCWVWVGVCCLHLWCVMWFCLLFGVCLLIWFFVFACLLPSLRINCSVACRLCCYFVFACWYLLVIDWSCDVLLRLLIFWWVVWYFVIQVILFVDLFLWLVGSYLVEFCCMLFAVSLLITFVYLLDLLIWLWCYLLNELFCLMIWLFCLVIWNLF